ncbi:GNAT family N-acetyltransferase [Actinokineospora auranticolor]|uniref:Putative N-acyltransferase n=1 Tax=Actinokineospora auranticolor TaxID=155976 RepID=A0A2S6GPP9_9PSEU|nr:GNAT family N-acetyltransferase [Actinokineospora auranticolor]PPK67176.1 putative N-acyltransferase [Actinokineospora auranticolor]
MTENPTTSSPGVRLRTHVRFSADDLPPDWDELAADLDAPVFHTIGFMRAYEHNPVQSIARPRYVEVRDREGALLAAAPAYIQGDPLSVLGLAEGESAFLSPMWHCPGARVLARDEWSLRALCAELGKQAAEVGCARWAFINVEERSPAAAALVRAGSRSTVLVPRWVLHRDQAPDLPTYLASLRSSMRREFARHLRRAADHGARSLVHRADYPGLPALMEFVAATATKAGSPKYYNPPKLAAFLRELGEPVRVLEVQDRDGATLSVGVSFLERKRLQYWAAGYLRDRPELGFSPYYRMWGDMLELMWSTDVEVAECGRLNEPFKVRMGLSPRHQVALLGPGS